MIQLYLESPRKGMLRPSHTNHNSETRARTLRDVIDNMGEADAWDWKEVTSFSRRLNNFIRKGSVGKEGSIVILPNAHKSRSQGIVFSLN